MAGDDEEIVVTIEGEPPLNAQDTVVKIEGDGSKKAAGANGDDIVDSLKAQLAEKQTALDSVTQRVSSAEAIAGQATQRARQLEQEVVQARTEVDESSKATIDSGIAAAKAEAQAAQEALTAAGEAGDWKALAQAQRRMSRAEAELVQLESAKDSLPAQPQRRVQQVANRQVDDPAEAFINSRTAPTQAWLRSHRDYLTDPKKNAKMQAAHYDAESEGIALDSPQYFEHVERFLGLRKEETEQKPDGAQQKSQRRPTAPVAPVTPSAGGMNGGAVEVRLSAAEARAADDGSVVWNTPDPTGKNRWKVGDPVGRVEFARRKMLMMKEGRYSNISVDGT